MPLHHHWMMLEERDARLPPSLDDVRGSVPPIDTIIG